MKERMLSVLLVEDEFDLRESMCTYIAAAGFDVRGVADAIEFDRAWRRRPADILVLDVNLPGEDGFSIVTRMRAVSKTVGILILSARTCADDRVAGLELGADSYLVKPVELREVAAALGGLARRLPVPTPAPPDPVWSFDRRDWSLIAPNSGRVELTAAEFGLIHALATSPGTPVTVETILTTMGKPLTESHRRSLDSLLSRLRRKVEDATGHALPVKSVRSVGYVFAAPMEGDLSAQLPARAVYA